MCGSCAAVVSICSGSSSPSPGARQGHANSRQLHHVHVATSPSAATAMTSTNQPLYDVNQSDTAMTSTNQPLYDVNQSATAMTSTNQPLYDVTNATMANISVVPHNVSADVTVPEGCVVLQVGEFLPWDNPDNIVSLETEKMVEMLSAVLSANIFFLISVPTNVLNMLVFYRHGLKERINLCAFCQSLVDLGFMTFFFFYYLDRPYMAITGKTDGGFMMKFFMNNNLIALYALSYVSGFTTTVIALERCLCVVSPLRSRQILKTRTMLVIIVGAFVFFPGLAFVTSSRWSVVCAFNPLTDTTSDRILPSTPFYLENKQFIDFMTGYVYPSYRVLSVVIVTVCTIVTVKKLRDMTKWRDEASSVVMSSRDVALTRMLVGCSILYIVCVTPDMLIRLCWIAIPDFSFAGRYRNFYNMMYSFVAVFSHINSSTNFFVYYTLGSRYRETLKSLCSRKAKAKPETHISK